MRLLIALLTMIATMASAQAAEGKLVSAYSGNPTFVYSLYALGLDCQPVPNGEFHFTMPVPPAHGKLYWTNALVIPQFPASNPRHVCNGVGRHGMQIIYRSAAGYKGPDKFTLEVTFPAGAIMDISRPVTVH